MSARLRQAAELFRTLSRDAGRELEYDRAGVAWADQYVQGVRPVESEEQLRVHTALVGAFLGESLLAVCGGEWVQDAEEWAVELGARGRAHPFRQTLEQLREGEAHSILAHFDALVPEAGGAEAAAEAEAVAAAAPSPATLRETADRLMAVIRANGGPDDYGEAAVAFVDEFVNNARPVEEGLLDQYTALVGAVLGESVIARHGGGWSAHDGLWSVRSRRGAVLHPFSSARRQLENGADDSILALFRALDAADASETPQSEPER